MAESDRNYENECGDHGGRNSSGDPCGRPAGWGTDFEDGKCRHHRGTNADGSSHEGNTNAVGNDGGAPEDNTNAVTHALFVESNRFYQQVIDDPLRELCDQIYESYVEKFRRVNGDPIVGEKARLSEIAVNHIKIIHSDNWATDKPADLESGNAFVDRETRIKTTEHDMREEHRYTESVVTKTQQRLRKEDRKWLKEYNMLGADEIAVDVSGEVDHSHDHEHGLDESTQDLIDDLAEDLRA
ncbi:hypothetical protein [Natrarchaeobius oligotrophus]|uniref:Uncharacterized protein n=1 Tax=Natrarchaeobius chitinivorans TaxID=1679083 RepID=A0A3N6LU57_NATCH|nr:hypothetical protein [Natrarchaeobius chitinivorans]RQG93743.1 hypothetical protein EA472_22685 [Natrarchaeobius chitinivorans]